MNQITPRHVYVCQHTCREIIWKQAFSRWWLRKTLNAPPPMDTLIYSYIWNNCLLREHKGWGTAAHWTNKKKITAKQERPHTQNLAINSTPPPPPSVETHDREETQNPELFPPEQRVWTSQRAPKLLRHTLGRWTPKSPCFEKPTRLKQPEKWLLKWSWDWIHLPQGPAQR